MSVAASHPLRVQRERAGLSLRKLAELAHVDFTKLHHIEHGREPREDELLRLSGVLKVPADALRVNERV